MIKLYISLLLIIPGSCLGMLRFFGLEHRPTDEITKDIARAELMNEEYEKNEKLRSLYGEWHEAVVSQPKFNEKFALAIEELYLKHKDAAELLKRKQEKNRKDKVAEDKTRKQLEETIRDMVKIKLANEDLEAKEARLISVIPYLEKLKELNVLDFDKFQTTEQQLSGIKKIVARKNIEKKIEILEAEKDLAGLIHAHYLLLNTFETDRLRSSTQAMITQLENELRTNNNDELVETQCALEHAALSAQIDLLKLNTKKSDFARKAEYASLLEKRARVYKNQPAFKGWCDEDTNKARALWLQALAIAPNSNAKQEIVKHLQ